MEISDNIILFVIALLVSVVVSQDVCSLPPEVGDCDAVVPMYFFNSSAEACQSFIWGGCGGNANKFETLEKCRAACGDTCVGKPLSPRWSEICELPASPGPCQLSLARYYYNSACRRCETFAYGGCGGNDNRFETLSDCAIACVIGRPA